MVTAKNILLCTWHCCRTLYYYLSLYNSKDTDSCHMGVGKISTILLKTELTLCTQLPPQFTHNRMGCTPHSTTNYTNLRHNTLHIYHH